MMANRLRLQLALSGVLGCLLLGFALFWREAAPASVLVLTRPYRVPLRIRDRIGSWIPRATSWNWARRLEDAMFGRRALITLDTEILELPDFGPSLPGTLGLRRPDLSQANGLQVWILEGVELRSLQHRLKQEGAETINRPRITTADGIEASLFSGNSIRMDGVTNQVGVEAAYYARVNPARTDLFASVQMTSLVTNVPGEVGDRSAKPFVLTNLAVALRLQIPNGSGVFVISTQGSRRPVEPRAVIIGPP